MKIIPMMDGSKLSRRMSKSDHHLDEIREIRSPSDRHGDVSGRFILLRIDLGERNADRYMLNVALALRDNGHDVTFVTCSCHPRTLGEIFDFKICKIGQWIPKNIFGHLHYLMYCIRSSYAALWVARTRKKLKPTLVISTGCPIVCFFLSIFGKLSVIQYQSFSDLRLLNKLPNETIIMKKGFFYRKSLSYADEILVPNKMSRLIFANSFPNIIVPPTVLYPCVDVGPMQTDEVIPIKRFVRDCPVDGQVFTVIGEYRERSNFTLAIEAFASMLDMLDTWEKRSRVHLVIAGQCNEHIREHRQYLDKLLFSATECKYGGQISFLKLLPDNCKKSLIVGSVAVLHTAVNDVFNQSLIDCLYFGKAVIACNSGVPAEIILHRITGFLVPPDPNRFAKAMKFLLENTVFAGYIGYLCLIDFENRFCFSKFAHQIGRLVSRYGKDVKGNTCSKSCLMSQRESCLNMLEKLKSIKEMNKLDHLPSLETATEMEEYIRSKTREINEADLAEDEYFNDDYLEDLSNTGIADTSARGDCHN